MLKSPRMVPSGPKIEIPCKPYELRSILLVGQQDMDPISRLQWEQNRSTMWNPVSTLNTSLLSMVLTVAHIASPGEEIRPRHFWHRLARRLCGQKSQDATIYLRVLGCCWGYWDHSSVSSLNTRKDLASTWRSRPVNSRLRSSSTARENQSFSSYSYCHSTYVDLRTSGMIRTFGMMPNSAGAPR